MVDKRITSLLLLLGLSWMVVSASASEESVDVKVYWMSVAQFQEGKSKFTDAVSAIATKYCRENTDCSPATGVNMTTSISEVEKYGNDVKFDLTISNLDGSYILPARVTSEILESEGTDRPGGFDLLDIAGYTVLGVGEREYTKPADVPSNWIIIGVMVGLTIVLLVVTLYLIKHKVNDADEHFEQLKEQGPDTAIEA